MASKAAWGQNILDQNFELPLFLFSPWCHSIVVFILVGLTRLLLQDCIIIVVIAMKGLQEWTQQLNGMTVKTGKKKKKKKGNSKFWSNFPLVHETFNLKTKISCLSLCVVIYKGFLLSWKSLPFSLQYPPPLSQLNY